MYAPFEKGYIYPVLKDREPAATMKERSERIRSAVRFPRAFARCVWGSGTRRIRQGMVEVEGRETETETEKMNELCSPPFLCCLSLFSFAVILATDPVLPITRTSLLSDDVGRLLAGLFGRDDRLAALSV